MDRCIVCQGALSSAHAKARGTHQSCEPLRDTVKCTHCNKELITKDGRIRCSDMYCDMAHGDIYAEMNKQSFADGMTSGIKTDMSVAELIEEIDLACLRGSQAAKDFKKKIFSGETQTFTVNFAAPTWHVYIPQDAIKSMTHGDDGSITMVVDGSKCRATFD